MAWKKIGGNRALANGVARIPTGSQDNGLLIDCLANEIWLELQMTWAHQHSNARVNASSYFHNG